MNSFAYITLLGYHSVKIQGGANAPPKRNPAHFMKENLAFLSGVMERFLRVKQA